MITLNEAVRDIVGAFTETNIWFTDEVISGLTDDSDFPVVAVAYSDELENVKRETMQRRLRLRIWDRYPPGCATELEALRITARDEIQISKERIRTITRALVEYYGFDYTESEQTANITWKEQIRGATEFCLYGVEATVTLIRSEKPRCCDMFDPELLTCKISKGVWS